MAKVRKAHMAIPTMCFDDSPMEVQNDRINFHDQSLHIQEGLTKNFVEISQEFFLTTAQVAKETAKYGTCKTLARMAAKAVALGEDAYFFQCADRSPVVRNLHDREELRVNFPGGVRISNWNIERDFGLLAEANPPDASDHDFNKVARPIIVEPIEANSNHVIWGQETFKAVTRGIAKLVSKGQATDYALFLPTDAFADTFAPPGYASLVTTAERIKPLVEGGFYDSAVLPQDEGLLIALAGEPQKLFVGTEAHVEFIRHQEGRHYFRVAERVQYVVREARSLVLLKFRRPPHHHHQEQE
ncbi:MAG: encapsulin [Nostoc sp.]